MREPEADTLLFFNEHPKALLIYEHLEETIYDRFPVVNKRVQKTQIGFSNRHLFACVSFARVKRKAELPDPCEQLLIDFVDAPNDDVNRPSSRIGLRLYGDAL